MKATNISRLTTNRLSLYLRCLNMLEEAGVATVSSRELAEQFHLNSAQIRKDLACFGEFGVRGVGYSVPDLKRQLVEILGLGRSYNVVIVGAGNLGMALSGYGGFYEGGFRIAAMVDSSQSRIRALSAHKPAVHHTRQLKRLVRTEGINIAVLAVPARAGQAALDTVYRAGIRAVLNFVPVRMKVPADCELVTVDLKIQLESLAYHLAGTIGRTPLEDKRNSETSSQSTRPARPARSTRSAPPPSSSRRRSS